MILEEPYDVMMSSISSCCRIFVYLGFFLRNRFKGLDLIGRVPDELWTEVHDIVQKTGIKTIPMENAKKQNGC